jgi:hypothetical protein
MLLINAVVVKRRAPCFVGGPAYWADLRGDVGGWDEVIDFLTSQLT